MAEGGGRWGRPLSTAVVYGPFFFRTAVVVPHPVNEGGGGGGAAEKQKRRLLSAWRAPQSGPFGKNLAIACLPVSSAVLFVWRAESSSR